MGVMKDENGDKLIMRMNWNELTAGN